MPNGGPDHCGACKHNPNGGVCTLRDVVIVGDPFGTYCDNFFGRHARGKINKQIRGPIFSDGLHEPVGVLSYHRIPWLDDRRPKAGRPVKCFDCGDYVEYGIEIELRTKEKFGFCSNKNYIRWWMNQTGKHPEWTKKTERLCDCPKVSGGRVNGFVVKDKGEA